MNLAASAKYFFVTALLACTGAVGCAAEAGDDDNSPAHIENKASRGDTKPKSFSISERGIAAPVAGLTEDGLLLSMDGEEVRVPARARLVQFQTMKDIGSHYDVRVVSQPEGQVCTIVNGTGAVTSMGAPGLAIQCR